MIRALWFLCIAATVWFALIPSAMGGIGGAGYHGVAFMVLGLLTPAAFPRLSLWLIWAALVAFGGGIELGQELMQFNRHGEWNDFATDAVAATVGIVYYRVWLYLRGQMAREGDAAEDDSDSPS